MKIKFKLKTTILLGIILFLVESKAICQQYLPLTGGNLTGQLQAPYFGINPATSPPANSGNTSLFANISTGSLDIVGWYNGWRFIPNNGSSYPSTPVFSIDLKGNTNIAGNVGIGTTTPMAKLDINGAIYANGNESHLSASTYVDPVPGVQYSLKIGSLGIAVNGNSVFNNSVGINTTNTKGYQLAVNGSAIATSMTVKLQTNWPDYVFTPTYTLPTLGEVKTYIDQNHHLPEIPSEEEVIKNGVNLGEMNKLLVKKVEELTLYLIEKDKAINKQSDLLKQFEARLEKVEQAKSKN